MPSRLLPVLLLLGACTNRPSAEEQAIADALGPNDANMMISDDIETVDAGPSARTERHPLPTIDYFPPSMGEPSISCRWNEGRLQPILSDFERRWYSGQLAAAGEPSLFLASQNRPAGGKSLRFTWLPTFHHPVIVRIEWAPSGEARLLAVRLSGAGGYDPGTAKDRIDRLLTPAEVRNLEAALARARLFLLAPKMCDGGGDGSEWIFEAVDNAGYHYLDRWAPRKGGPREIGILLLSLTGWRFESVY